MCADEVYYCTARERTSGLCLVEERFSGELT